MLNVLLIDDEQMVLKGMQYVLKKDKHLCRIIGTANDGEEGLQLIDELHPDVVITDIKMPGMDGIELIRKAKQQYPELYFIILSGYSDFQYARNALRYGAYDYLLKPCKYNDIAQLLTKISEELTSRIEVNQLQAALEKSLDESKREIRKQKLMDIIIGKDISHDIKMDHLIRVVVIEYDTERTTIDVSDTLNKKINELIDSNVLEEVLTYKNQCIIILEDEYSLKNVKEQLYFLKLEIMRMGISLRGVISGIHMGVKGLIDAYKQCVTVAEYLCFNEKTEIRELSEIEKVYKIHEPKIHTVIFNEESIIKKIFLGDISALEYEINNTIKKMEQVDELHDPNAFRTQLKHLMVLIEKKLKDKEISIEMIFDRSIECIYEIQRIKNYRQLLNWCKNMMITISRYIKETKNHLPKPIQAAITYIDKYYNKDISMKLVAEKVFLNPWYFSELFKEKMGTSFSDYLTQIRINQAKELLKRSDLKNYEIAEMVGFKNSTYFNVVFKKVEGLTPKVYRKSL